MRKFLFLLLFLTLNHVSKAQLWGGGVDDEPYHFGFSFQYVSSEIKLIKNPDWRKPFFDPGVNNYVTDSLQAIFSKPNPGFGVGFVINYRLSEHADVRLLPILVFNDRKVFYQYQQPAVYNTSGSFLVEKAVQSTMAEFPFSIKLKSDRRKNFRAYIAGGAKYSIDISSKKRFDDEGSAPADKLLKMKRAFLSYETAIGFDIYFEHFKLAPELKLSYSFKDILAHDNTPYANPIEKAMLRHFSFSLYVE